MKIIFYIQGMTTEKGGAQRVVANLANWLTTRNHVPVIFFERSNNNIPAYPLAPQIKCYSVPEVIPAGLSLPELGHISCVYNAFYSPGTANPLILAKKYNCPLVTHEHNAPWYIEKYLNDPSDRTFIHGASDKLVLLCNQYKNSVSPEFLDKTCIIPNAVSDISQLKDKQKSGRPKVLFVGRLFEEQKRVSLLIQAFSKLAKRFPDWDLEIIGTGEDKDKYAQLSTDLELQDRIRFVGKVEDMKSHYLNSDIFCLPSSHEGMSMAMLEALGYNLPYVGFASCRGVEDVITDGKNGLLAPEFSAQSLADTLARVMEDEDLRKSLARGAHKRAQDFAQEKIFDRWLELFEEMENFRGNTALGKMLKSDDEHLKAELNKYMNGEPEKALGAKKRSSFISQLRKKVSAKNDRTIPQ